VSRPAAGLPGEPRERFWLRLAWPLYGVAWLLAPWLFGDGLGLSLLSQIGIASIVCLSYNILLGQGGMLSFGHALFSGFGAFLAMHTLQRVAGGWPVPVSLIPLVGGLSALLLALLLGWVSTRRSATPFAMITLGLGELAWSAALMFPAFSGGEAGLTGDRTAGGAIGGWTLGPALQLYWLIAVYTLVCTLLMYGFTRTPLGRLLNAARDNAERVAFTGHDPHMVRYLAFAIAAFFAGISGGLAALHFEVVTADVLAGQRSGTYLLFTVLGGTGFFAGPIIGAIVMVLSLALFSALTPAWLLYLGLGFMLTVIYLPGGLASLATARFRQQLATQLRRAPAACLALVGAWLLMLAGLSALVELAYQWHLRSAMGDALRFAGLSLNAASPASWSGAAMVALAGAALARWLARRIATAATLQEAT
jgi:branched-chain amino acid transport system permease protein